MLWLIQDGISVCVYYPSQYLLEECVLSLCVSDAGSWMFDDLLRAELIYLARNRRGRARLERKM